MKNHWIKRKKLKDCGCTKKKAPSWRADVNAFLEELRQMVHGLSDEVIVCMDFKPLYAKYPRARLGIQRALLVVRT